MDMVAMHTFNKAYVCYIKCRRRKLYVYVNHTYTNAGSNI